MQVIYPLGTFRNVDVTYGVSPTERRNKPMLIGIFNNTHDTEVISSIDDTKKASPYNLPELNDAYIATRLSLLAERRPETMEWVYLKS
jgi:hypothetical protein